MTLTLCSHLHEALLSTLCVEIPFSGPAMDMTIAWTSTGTGHSVTGSLKHYNQA